MFPQESVKAGEGSGIPSLPKFDPEYHQTCVRVPAAHIVDEPDFFRPAPVGMVAGSV